MTGQELKEIRLKLNISQGQMAKILKVKNKQLIYQWENNLKHPRGLIIHIYKLLDSLPDDMIMTLVNDYLNVDFEESA